MKNLKFIVPTIVGLAVITFSAQSHAESIVFGNVGIIDPPLSILLGYNDYGRHYYDPPRVEHHHYYPKPHYKYHKDKRHYYKHHGGYDYYKYHRPRYSRGGYCPY